MKTDEDLTEPNFDTLIYDGKNLDAELKRTFSYQEFLY
jgi:hypothetical protein